MLLIQTRSPRRAPRLLTKAAVALALLGLVAVLAAAIALVGGEFGCMGGGSVSPVSTYARDAIPAARLALYRRAGGRFDLDWAFLAAIGAQECSHGRCRGVNASGCGGPMQIAVRRGSACSPGPGPTLWQRFGVDADRDGRRDFNDPADAAFTAARLLRHAKGAPAAGGSYAEHRRAACNYYGTCADGPATYADEVMARAVRYGFRGVGVPASLDLADAQAGCGGAPPVFAGGALDAGVRRAYRPRRLRALAPFATADGTLELCDARIAGDVEALARRYAIRITGCYGTGHAPQGEHPLGAAIDAVPAGGDWTRTMRLATDLGWRRSCAASGTRPECAGPPIRFIAYNGYPNHGDPDHCFPCTGGPHLHISWQTSASAGQPEHRPRYRYQPASWIEVFAPRRKPPGGAA
jgi:hypothetical protein